MSEKVPDLRERPVDYELCEREGKWIIIDLQGNEFTLNDEALARAVKANLVTQLWSDENSVDAVPGSDVPDFYDKPSTTAVWPEGFTDSNRVHQETKKVVETNCHKAAEVALPQAFERRFDYEWDKYESFEELEVAILTSKLPAVIQTGRRHPDYEMFDELHSAVALTQGNDSVIVFEKFGYSLPYQLVSLKEVYDYWVKASRKVGLDLYWKIVTAE